jgi:hypothetical protein
MNNLLLARWVKFPSTPLEQATKKAMYVICILYLSGYLKKVL